MTEVGSVYGESLYGLAKDEGLSHDILAQLQVLQQSFDQEPDFVRLLSSPNLAKQERCQILDSSFRGKIHAYVLNFLKLLTEKGYIRHFSACCDAYTQHYNQDNGILPVTAVTSLPLSDELRRKLTDKLSSVTGKTIELECRTDPECLGGVRLDLGGVQVDGTIHRRLDEIRATLKNTVL